MNFEKFKTMSLDYFNKYFLDYVKNQYTNFNGRVSRRQYWFFVLFYVVLSIPLIIVDALLGIRLLTMILALALVVPSIGIGVRRLHDLGKPGWWYFMALVPVLGAIALIVLFCLPGEAKDNQYGKPVD